MIRDALSALPTRPVLIIAPLLVVVVLSLYYWDRYAKCAGIKQYRATLNELLRSQSRASSFRLADSTDFKWEGVRIVESFKPDQKNADCPFGWNWSEGLRQQLVESGILTVLVFVDQGAIVNYFELRSDEVDFRGVESSLTPETAVFRVGVNAANSDGVTLTMKN